MEKTLPFMDKFRELFDKCKTDADVGKAVIKFKEYGLKREEQFILDQVEYHKRQKELHQRWIDEFNKEYGETK